MSDINLPEGSVLFELISSHKAAQSKLIISNYWGAVTCHAEHDTDN